MVSLASANYLRNNSESQKFSTGLEATDSSLIQTTQATRPTNNNKTTATGKPSFSRAMIILSKSLSFHRDSSLKSPSGGSGGPPTAMTVTAGHLRSSTVRKTFAEAIKIKLLNKS
jgi:hypothetical protein